MARVLQLPATRHSLLCEFADKYVNALVDDHMLGLFLCAHGLPEWGEWYTDRLTAWDYLYDEFSQFETSTIQSEIVLLDRGYL